MDGRLAGKPLHGTWVGDLWRPLPAPLIHESAFFGSPERELLAAPLSRVAQGLQRPQSVLAERQYDALGKRFPPGAAPLGEDALGPLQALGYAGEGSGE